MSLSMKDRLSWEVPRTSSRTVRCRMVQACSARSFVLRMVRVNVWNVSWPCCLLKSLSSSGGVRVGICFLDQAQVFVS
ncbi:hypothetical protein A3L22_30720 [Streptomyces griseus subsp. griseus]|nr:hypothetical protein A3L22_30720 [Streptomyces griseus subsp. griseus]